MLIAFWNINTGKGSFRTRTETFARWCASRQPHLLFLEEVSHTLVDDLPLLTGMKTLGFANTLDRNDNPSTKQLHAMARRNIKADYSCRTVRFPGLTSRRALLKVSAVAGPLHGSAIWVIHANASKKGGTAAVAAVNTYLAANDDAMVGGDFNCAFADAGVRATRPQSWQPNNLRFTQWNKTAGTTSSPDASLHLTAMLGTAIYAKVVRHRVIDYVMTGNNRMVGNVPNCTTEGLWRDILACFDHCPVVYNIT
jgi:hypothetical protein